MNFPFWTIPNYNHNYQQKCFNKIQNPWKYIKLSSKSHDYKKLCHGVETGMIHDTRSFVKQKCTIEKSYAESLLKLSSNFQNKKVTLSSIVKHDLESSFYGEMQKAHSC